MKAKQLKELLGYVEDDIDVVTNNIKGFPDVVGELLIMECDRHKVLVLNGAKNKEHPFCRDYKEIRCVVPPVNTNCNKNCLYLDKANEKCNLYNKTIDFGNNNNDTLVKCKECIKNENEGANNGN